MLAAITRASYRLRFRGAPETSADVSWKTDLPAVHIRKRQIADRLLLPGCSANGHEREAAIACGFVVSDLTGGGFVYGSVEGAILVGQAWNRDR